MDDGLFEAVHSDAAVLPQAQLQVLAAWAVVGLLLIGIGSLFRSACRAPAQSASDFVLSFWLGWACAVLGLQVWQLLAPVDDRARFACVALGALGLAVSGPRRWLRVLRSAPRGWVAIVASVAAAVWLSNHALSGARYGDAGAYFVPTIRWLAEHPIIPGLGNLHGHYALNQSYFLYVALLEGGPLPGRSSHVANGLLVLALCVRAAIALGRVCSFGRAARFEDLFYVLLLPGTLSLGMSILLTSPSPDQAIFALGAVASGELLALLTGAPARRVFHLYAIALLVVTGVTVKLSLAGLALAMLPLAFLLWLRRDRPTLAVATRTAGVVGVLGVAAVAPWIVRNVVMSGCPLFPNTFAALPVEWRVQTDVEGWLRNTVYTGGWRAIVNTPGWYLERLRAQGWTAPDVLGPLLVAGAGTAAALAVRLARLARRARPTGALTFAVLIPALTSLGFCLVMSPVPRYAGATVWVLAATGVLLAGGARPLEPGSRPRLALLVGVVCATALTMSVATEPLWRPLGDFEVTGRPPYRARRLKTGFVVNVPVGPDACWDAPLPCTPFPNPALRLRRAGDLRSGFMLDPAVNARYRYDPGRPFLRH